MGLRDPVSSLSHLLAAGWAAGATVALVRAAPPGRRAAAGVFGGSMVALYLASGMFHGVPYTLAARPAAFRLFQTLDRSAIFLLIAGTNTPVMACLLDGRWRRWCLRAMWGLAAAGVATLWALPQPPFGLAVGVYVGMGWLGAVPLRRYVRAVGWRGMGVAAAGGLLYTAGAGCDLAGWPTVAGGPHEVFHLLTVAGSGAFYVFVRRHVLPYAQHGSPPSVPPA